MGKWIFSFIYNVKVKRKVYKIKKYISINMERGSKMKLVNFLGFKMVVKVKWEKTFFFMVVSKIVKFIIYKIW